MANQASLFMLELLDFLRNLKPSFV